MTEQSTRSDRHVEINPFAAAIALGGAGTLDPRAAAYIEKQSRLTDLQIEDMERENRLRHWSLRFGNVSAIMKVAFEIALAFIFLAIATGIAAAIWTAAHDKGLVIEAFSVPPDMAARGISGQAVAAQVEDRLAELQDATGSARPADSYASNWGDDIRVQIPDTGVSVGEFYRLLVSWLGHQTRISGEVWRSGDAVAISVRAGGDGAATVTGKITDFSALVRQAAEAVYRRTQPYRYAAYLETSGFVQESADPSRLARAKAILSNLSIEGATVRERAWAFVGLGVDALFSADIPGSATAYRQAIALNPDSGLAFSDLDYAEAEQEHEEAALAAARRSVRLLDGDAHADITARARAITLLEERANSESDVGDYGAAVADYAAASHLPDYSGEVEVARESAALDLALAHDMRAARTAWQNLPATNDPATLDSRLSNLPVLNADLGQWSQALSGRGTAGAALQRTFYRHQAAQMLWPHIALAMAHGGDIAGGAALIARTPLDCDFCVRVRGRIAARARDWAGAAHWFRLLSKRTPSIPLADCDWGEMLLHKGEYEGAIAKFEAAHTKGPHFADPLEMWGEALMAKNRSDLALVKFEEANTYAPNWGRLHLKWGEALSYAEKKDEARKQFAIASHLDLSAVDSAALARARANLP